MTYTESDLLPISALQHLLFCERQCALIHVERLWDDNRYTAEGNILHKKAHEGKPETRDGERITRGLPLRSFELGLSGVADVVLWRAPVNSNSSKEGSRRQTLTAAIRLATPNELAEWEVTPVEYKRGKPKKNDCDRVQLCAQAMCLEEMMQIKIDRGQLFYGTTRRRCDVDFDTTLRATTRLAATRFHHLMANGEIPLAVREKKCDTCSLYDVCLPPSSGRQLASDYLREIR